MHRRFLTIIVGVVLVVASFGAGYLLRGGRDTAMQPTVSPSPSSAVRSVPPGTPTVSPVAHTVSMTDRGPSPKTLSVRFGDVVTFRNDGSRAFWPVSDPHPSHNRCPWLDSARGLRTGEEYSVVVPSSAVCSYHDHLDPADKTRTGTITAL